MIDRTSHLQNIEEQLMPLYYEISLLESKIEVANADVKDRGEEFVRSLHNQYKFVETQVQALSEDINGVSTREISEVDKSLKDLLCQFELIGQWIWVVTSG